MEKWLFCSVIFGVFCAACHSGKASLARMAKLREQLLTAVDRKHVSSNYDLHDRALLANKYLAAKLGMKERLNTELRKINIKEAKKDFPSKSREEAIHYELLFRLLAESVLEANAEAREFLARKNFFCFNGGQALPGFRCACGQGFSGPRCEHEHSGSSRIDCRSRGCKNGGKCIPFRGTSRGSNFSVSSCRCPRGFGGHFCENRKPE